MNSRFQQVVAVITLVLIFLSIVATFIGAFTDGDMGKGFLFGGIFGFVFFAILGWAMITIYGRVHKDDEEVKKMTK